MGNGTTRHTRHSVLVCAPSRAIYDIIADVSRWPWTFTPTVHAEQLSANGTDEHIAIWALANGEVKSWTSRRQLDAAALRIEFRQDISQHPVAEMSGVWTVEALSPAQSRVTLTHDFRAVDDEVANLEWIQRAVDDNSTAELAKLKAAAEQQEDQRELILDFTDAVEVAGNPQDVHDFLARAELWGERLPHVARIDVQEDSRGVQILAMDTRSPDGDVHTTESIRVCLPPDRIVYKQTVLPALMTVHVGQWTIEETPGGCTVSSRHVVALDPGKITPVLGPAATLAHARDLVRGALGSNSLTTLRRARSHAEERARG
ncbi:aromatase/cyclase [Streptomyces celluloflavus]|uniref:aromatase/cyclase n=1 Tax=Streptomyces celluloflavus TaxID=58344 RepID=UPI003649EB33